MRDSGDAWQKRSFDARFGDDQRQLDDISLGEPTLEDHRIAERAGSDETG
jgi:hypothetical protein